MKRKAASPRKAAPRPGRRDAVPEAGEIAELAGEVASHRETGPVLSGGDLDADWQRAHDAGDEAVGGSVATPDQDVVDEIGRAQRAERGLVGRARPDPIGRGDTMRVEIRGIPGDHELHTYVARRLESALPRLSVRPVGAHVVFVDENGPKGGLDIRCALTVPLPYRPSMRVEHVAETARLAFDQAFAVLERQLERYVERDRDRKRRPKKYFVAKRLLAAAGATAGRPAPTGR